MLRTVRLLRSVGFILITTGAQGIQFLRLAVSSRSALSAEVLFLRKQLAFYQEHQIPPRKLTDAARFSLVLWSRLFHWREALMIVKPETLIGWHRQGFKLFWRWKSRMGRPRIPENLRRLIVGMAQDNPTWGEERVAAELSVKLGILVSPRTVRAYWPRETDPRSGRRTSSQHWQAFVRNHAQAIVAADFFGRDHRRVPRAVCVRGHGGGEPSHSALQCHGSSDRWLDAAAVPRSHSQRSRVSLSHPRS
jgi:hypothetical protein